MIELYSNFQGSLSNCEVTLPYYEVSDFPFNFNFIFDADDDGNVSADYIRDGILNWINCVPEGNNYFHVDHFFMKSKVVEF